MVEDSTTIKTEELSEGLQTYKIINVCCDKMKEEINFFSLYNLKECPFCNKKIVFEK